MALLLWHIMKCHNEGRTEQPAVNLVTTHSHKFVFFTCGLRIFKSDSIYALVWFVMFARTVIFSLGLRMNTIQSGIIEYNHK
jgi:hypothetical protein